jgi:hypothetical protein
METRKICVAGGAGIKSKPALNLWELASRAGCWSRAVRCCPSELMLTPKVLLVANTSWYLYNFRLPLIRDLRGRGIDVALVAPHDAFTSMLEAEGFTVHPWLVARSSVNPLSEAHALVDLLRIYRRETPDLVHHFTIKACLYGTIAAKGARVYRVINAVTGLGHVFLGTRKRSRLLRQGDQAAVSRRL